VFGLQDAIADRAARALALQLTGADRELLVRRPTSDPDAYRLYLNGVYLWQQFDVTTMPSSINYFRAAVERDPRFAEAWAGLAKAYNQMGMRGGREGQAEAFTRSRQAAETALGLDPTIADAHVAVAARKIFHEWDWTGAAQALDRAAAHNPDDEGLHTLRGYLHMANGRTRDALREFERTLEVAPTWHIAKEDVMWGHLCARDLDAAEAKAAEALTLDASDAGGHVYRGWVLLFRGRPREAIGLLERARQLDSERSDVRVALAAAYARSGRSDDALKLVEEARSHRTSHRPLLLAELYANVGATDEAFRWLDRALEDRAPFLWTARVAPELEPLRADPRFAEFLRRFDASSARTDR
jgi:tetratricopeptide (TPR) repeat protein